MRRRTPLVFGALAFAGAAVGSGAVAQELPETTSSTTSSTAPPTSKGPTTTSPPVTAAPGPTSSTTRPSAGATSTTAKPSGPTTTTTLRSGAPVPPPPSGASQPLDPSLLGGLPMVLTPSTSLPVFSTEDGLTTTTVFNDDSAISVASSSDGPSGATLALASVAWLASLGGLLVYAEDQRGKQWRHLAR